MAMLLVGVPVIKDTRKVHIEKGRRWSVFEHAVLEALAKQDYSLVGLEKFSNLPARVVVEIVIRLMRAGWVELILTAEEMLFRTTPVGRLHATKLELPPVTKIFPRHLSFAVDLVTGNVFRRTDLTLVNEDQWLERTSKTQAVLLAELPEHKFNNVPVSTIAQTLLEDDEEMIRVDHLDFRPSKLIALVSVSGASIDGLGTHVPDVLRDVIEEAKRRLPKVQEEMPATIQVSLPEKPETRSSHPISFRSEDLIVGGANHRSAFQQAIRKSRFRLAIHSTFLHEKSIESWWQDILDAAKRDVMVDVLWGKSSERDGENDTLVAANRLRAMVAQAGLQSRIRVHPSTSRSHAKIVLADTGTQDRFLGIVGSCNWLASRFDAFEASLRLHEDNFVADVAFELAELGRPPDGHITEFSTEMLALGRKLSRSPSSSRASGKARIVLGSEHANLVLQARDKAKRNILLLSHQLGFAAGPNLGPLRTAAQANAALECQIFYNRFSKGIDFAKANQQLLDLSKANLKVAPVQRPRLHAKVLAWDNDNLVVTSQNWLSSDPGDNHLRAEIGVHLEYPSCGRIFRDRFVAAKDFSGT
ncbi:phospholipase D-like domain-containing protein [Bradyrhizobium sp. S3.9.1]|uniref:phospholipase D-like domain-containing protein n=1 Tax=Bradyrhizobium sp. S3.9.1 TaxID=3156431 RepID=UPI0033996C9E